MLPCSRRLTMSFGKVVGFGLITVLIVGTLGYFVHGGVNGVLALTLLCIAYLLLLILAFGPYTGFIAQGLAAYFIVWPTIARMTAVESSWLTTAIYWVFVIIGAVITLIITSTQREVNIFAAQRNFLNPKETAIDSLQQARKTSDPGKRNDHLLRAAATITIGKLTCKEIGATPEEERILNEIKSGA